MGSAKTLGACTRLTAAYALGLSLVLITALACTPLQLALRKPGERNKTFPEKVAEQYDCDRRPLPFVEIEKSDLVPTRLEPGEELNHRLVYVLCPAKMTDVMTGTLHTRILFEGQVIDRDDNDFKLKPGRWEVVNLFDVQAQAQPGVYSFTVEFKGHPGGDARRLEAESTFIVQAPSKDQ